MTQYSKKRGVGRRGEEVKTDEKRRQWNVNISERILNNLFAPPLEDGNTVINTHKKRITYTPEALFDKAREYFENIVETNKGGITVVPDVEDFCLFANISRSTFISYRRSDDPHMSEIANIIATSIADIKKQNAFAGLINPLAFAMDMNNNHDYVQSKTETTINSNISLSQVETNIQDIASRIPMEDIPLLTADEEGGFVNVEDDNSSK